jgi:4-hydroxybenzoate polyprenyltransferase
VTALSRHEVHGAGRALPVATLAGTTAVTAAALAHPQFVAALGPSRFVASLGRSASASVGRPATAVGGWRFVGAFGRSASASVGRPATAVGGSGLVGAFGRRASAPLGRPPNAVGGSGFVGAFGRRASAALGRPATVVGGSRSVGAFGRRASAALGRPGSVDQMGAWVLAGWYVARYGQAQLRVAADPSAARVRAAVGAGITSLPALQGALVARAGAGFAGLLVAAAAPLARWLSKGVSPT